MRTLLAIGAGACTLITINPVVLTYGFDQGGTVVFLPVLGRVVLVVAFAGLSYRWMDRRSRARPTGVWLDIAALFMGVFVCVAYRSLISGDWRRIDDRRGQEMWAGFGNWNGETVFVAHTVVSTPVLQVSHCDAMMWRPGPFLVHVVVPAGYPSSGLFDVLSDSSSDMAAVHEGRLLFVRERGGRWVRPVSRWPLFLLSDEDLAAHPDARAVIGDVERVREALESGVFDWSEIWMSDWKQFVPREEDVLRGLESKSPFIRSVSMQLIEAGTADLYPRAWAVMTSRRRGD